MKPDAEYLFGLLTAFQNAPNGTADITELGQAGYSIEDPKFEFHMLYLYDEGLINSDSGMFLDTSADGAKMWSDIPIRLTAPGHALIEQISSPHEAVAKIGFEY